MKYAKPKFKIKEELEFRMIFRFQKDTNHSSQMKFLKFLQYLQKNLLHTSSKISKKNKFWETFFEKELKKCSD